MLRRASCLALLAAILTAAPAFALNDQRATATHTVKALDKELNYYLKQAGGSPSALVTDLGTGETLYSVAAGTPRLPASVEKLYTTSTALFEFGPDTRFNTSVYGVGSLTADGIWDGTLFLKGGGDPTFGSAKFNAEMYGTGATVQDLVTNLEATGIRGVDGKIVGDDSYFDALRGGPSTDYQANTITEGQIDALSFDAGWTNANETTFQAHPTTYATEAFKTALKNAGVKLSKSTTVATGDTPSGARELAYVSSPPLSTLIELTNSSSDNYFAETLLKDIGARFGGKGSTAAGAAVVRRVIKAKLGLSPRLMDGSGLSRYDRTTARQVISLLEQMRTNPYFWNSLAIAGVRGTMQFEMLGTRAVNNCRGKTGTLHDVANLVGYCTAANGSQLAFAFLENGLTNSDWGHTTEDLMGETLAEYDGPKSTGSGSGAGSGGGGL
jgi:D-alanyl-D-alanine carboxypeptidase/D-alanyl-D-alanine-endopeptidase (penicillin-binding protein 4)